jgi:tetratricopeptide (TPR) repeat protein
MSARLAILLPACALLAGCAGFGVVSTSDPAQKLRDAVGLWEGQDRPLIAERLIREAIEIYQSNNDPLGLANAYRIYGFFFSSKSIDGKWNVYYRKSGFLDRSATFDTRFIKSIEYFEKARALYAANSRFDALTNVDLNLGFTYAQIGDTQKACESFDRSLADNHENRRLNPALRQVLPGGFASYEEYLAATKKRYGCPR